MAEAVSDEAWLRAMLDVEAALAAAEAAAGVIPTEAAAGAARVRDGRLAVQLGGASGRLASLGDRGLDVLRGLAGELGLAEPALPWHAARGRVVEVAGALAIAAGAAAKIAVDVALLAQTEVAEVAEGAPGGSSALPHKRNPVGSVEIDACFRGVQAQVGVLIAAQRAEHERAAGAWQAEWPALSEALRLAR